MVDLIIQDKKEAISILEQKVLACADRLVVAWNVQGDEWDRINRPENITEPLAGFERFHRAAHQIQLEFIDLVVALRTARSP